MAGRKPQPTAIKVLNGNPGGRPLNHYEPKPDLGEPEMPKGLSPLARREWKRLVTILLKTNVLTVVDGAALAIYCEAWATYMRALKDIKKNGLTYESGGEPVEKTVGDHKEIVMVGTVKKQSPSIGERDKALRVMARFLTEFGMTPSSRSRIKTEPVKKEDAFAAKYLNKKAG